MKTIGIIYHFAPTITDYDTDTSREIQFNFYAIDENLEVLTSGYMSEVITTNQILLRTYCYSEGDYETRKAVERFRLLNEDEGKSLTFTYDENEESEELKAMHVIMKESIEYCLNEPVEVKTFKELQPSN